MESVTAVAGEPIATHDVQGGGGLRLHVREWGNPNGPALLLIHGWSQSQLCWARQLDSPLARKFRIVTFDNRGHGMSEKPLEAENYVDGRLWADDVAAVIEQTDLDHPVVVAWSYGGFIVADYIRAYGEATIAAVNLVGGAVVLKPTFDHLRPGPPRERRARLRARSADKHRCDPAVSPCLYRRAAQRRRVDDRAVLEHGRSR